MSQTSFTNPYHDLSDDLASRINSDVPTDEYKMIQRIMTERGVIQTTVNLLWNKLINELKRRNITDFTRAADFVDFVVNSRLIHEAAPSSGVGTPTLRPNTEAKGPDDRPGTPRPRVATPTASDESADVSQRRRGKVGERNRKAA